MFAAHGHHVNGCFRGRQFIEAWLCWVESGISVNGLTSSIILCIFLYSSVKLSDVVCITSNSSGFLLTSVMMMVSGSNSSPIVNAIAFTMFLVNVINFARSFFIHCLLLDFSSPDGIGFECPFHL